MSRKILLISLSALLQANPIDIGTLNITSSFDSKIIKDVHNENLKNIDTASALKNQDASINIIRRSSIANDIIVRGQRKDNINITVDDGRIYGACANRMDPPISHIVSSNIDEIEVTKGPFNVEEFGSLSANVKVKTLTPKNGISGDFSFGYGSFGQVSNSLNISGGNEKFKFLLGGEVESSKAYKDGNGLDFVGQINKAIKEGRANSGNQYQKKYQKLDAYSKSSFVGKLFFKLSKNQDLKLGIMQNFSKNILYPSTPMDALYDDSKLYTLNYSIKNISQIYRNLEISLFQSRVDHPMSNRYKKASNMMGEITHHLFSKASGVKIKNSFSINKHNIVVGADYFKREWDGKYYKNGNPFPANKLHSIYGSKVINRAIFINDKFAINRLTFDIGVRYDHTTTSAVGYNKNSYNILNGYILSKYKLSEDSNIFVGIGKSSRVPDGKELYFKNKQGKLIGNPNLKAVINKEIDIGLKQTFGDFSYKLTLFYSKLDNFIFYNASKKVYENQDAKIYGINLSSTYFATNNLYFDFSLNYQRGKKSHPLSGQSGLNMPSIPPLKYTLALNYDFDDSLNFKAELVGATAWKKVDAENGEQKIPSYAIVNLKLKKRFKNIEFSIGVNNLFDRAYSVTNTYKDLTLLNGANSTILLNEPGRNIYAKISYRF